MHWTGCQPLHRSRALRCSLAGPRGWRLTILPITWRRATGSRTARKRCGSSKPTSSLRRRHPARANTFRKPWPGYTYVGAHTTNTGLRASAAMGGSPMRSRPGRTRSTKRYSQLRGHGTLLSRRPDVLPAVIKGRDGDLAAGGSSLPFLECSLSVYPLRHSLHDPTDNWREHPNTRLPSRAERAWAGRLQLSFAESYIGLARPNNGNAPGGEQDGAASGWRGAGDGEGARHAPADPRGCLRPRVCAGRGRGEHRRCPGGDRHLEVAALPLLRRPVRPDPLGRGPPGAAGPWPAPGRSRRG